MPEGFQSNDGTLGSWRTSAPDDFDWSGDEDGFWPVSRMRQGYIDYLTAKQLEIEEQKLSRHYYHGVMWSAKELEILRKRKQPIITYNRVGRKINSITSLVQRLREDPKAYPRHPNNAEGAEIATQAVREVTDACHFKHLDFMATLQAGIEGIGGVELKLVEGDHDDPDIGMAPVAGDDWFYDPRSFLPDFSDARFHGIAKWLDVEAAIELFPDQEETLRTLMVETGFDLTTHADREFKWIYVNEKRLRLVEMWYKYRGRWNWAFFCSMILLAQGRSPFVNERHQSMSRFIMWSAAVDHDGDRYGFVRNLKGPQDELNQRKSKALFITNTSRLTIQKGAVDDVETTRKEAARPDGVIEYNPGFEPPKPDDKMPELQAQLTMAQDARGEIDSFANIQPAIMMQDDGGDQSGVAINLLQKAGIADIGDFILAHREWKLRVYRWIWNTIQRVWTGERWIRIAGDQNLTRFIQINGTKQDQWGNPVLINALGAIDADIILDEGPDAANLLTEAYDIIKNDPTVPFPVKLELMPISQSTKDKINQLMAPKPGAPPDPKVQAEQVKLQGLQAKTQADIQSKQIQAQADAASAQAEIINDQQDRQAEREKMMMEMALAREKFAQERDTMIREAHYRAQKHSDNMAELGAKRDDRAQVRKERQADRRAQSRMRNQKAKSNNRANA